MARLLLAHGAEPEATDFRGCTPLCTAAKYQNIEYARVLLEHGANANAKEGCTEGAAKNYTPLCTAVKDQGTDDDAETRSERALELVRLLLDHGAQPKMQINDAGLTAVKVATDAKNTRALELMNGSF